MMKQNLKKTIIFSLLIAGTAFARTDDFIAYDVNECRFMLYDCKLSKPVEKAIVFGVSMIMDTYRDTFGFNIPKHFKINVTIICGKDKFLKYQQEQIGKIVSDRGYFCCSATPYGQLYQTVVLLNKYPEESKNSKAIQEMVSIVFHESSHMILEFQISSTPDWINEGLAEYFEGFNVFGPNKRVYLERNGQNWCKYWAKKGFPVELDKLLNMSNEEFHNLDRIDGVPSYTMSYSLVYFMMSSPQTEKVLKEILWDIRNSSRTGKVDSIKIIDENYRGGFKNFERQWKAWIPNAREYRPLRAFRNHLEETRSSVSPNDVNTIVQP